MVGVRKARDIKRGKSFLIKSVGKTGEHRLRVGKPESPLHCQQLREGTYALPEDGLKTLFFVGLQIETRKLITRLRIRTKRSTWSLARRALLRGGEVLSEGENTRIK